MAPTAGTRLRFQKATAKKQQHAYKPKKVPSLKNRIRALDRFLKRGGQIDEQTRAAKTKELQQLQQEQNGKERVEEEKKIAEKTKKPRFFERVKLMRKLKKAKAQMDENDDEPKYKKEYEAVQHDLMYLYYYPKADQYLSLFPSKPHSDDALSKQKTLRAAAIARFEDEQPLDAFHKFCTTDGSAAPAASAVAVLQVKKLSKDEEKKKRKARSKKDKSSDGPEKKKKKTTDSRVLADEDDEDNSTGKNDASASGDDEEDDFFLS